MDNMLPLISIIVPVYNIEKYVEKCILSISNQTYKNIEIIAIDDGSTDNSGKLLDDLSKKDRRIKVIHKGNSGVSAARNDGIDAAAGEYIVFVDGDDYIANDFVEYMLTLTGSGADFCLSTKCYSKNTESQTENDSIKKYSPSEAIALLLSCDVIVGCWNKIYKRSFLKENNIKFQTSLFYGEGLSFIITAAQLSNFVTVGNKKVYCYRRNNEMSACTNFNIEKIYNGEKSIKNIEANIINKTNRIRDALLLHLCMFYMGAVVRINTNHLKKIYENDYKKWLGFVRKNIFHILNSKFISLYRKLLLLAGCVSPSVLSFFDVKRRKSITNKSV